MIHKPAITALPIEPIIAERWSGRAYDPQKAVSHDDITRLLEAARWAPSCFGEAPWRFVVWDKNQDPASWQRAYDCLVPGNQEWAKNAPVLALAASVKEFSHNGKNNRWHGYDTGAASVSICLQATALGLMTHQMGGFDVDKVRQTFAIPENVDLWAMMTIGYALSEPELTAEQRERELQPRQRRPLAEQFYHGGWPSPDNAGD